MQKLDAGWNIDTLAEYIRRKGANVEEDNEGQILLYTDLYEWSDGTLHDEPEDAGQ